MALLLVDPTDNKIVWCKFMVPNRFLDSCWCSEHFFLVALTLASGSCQVSTKPSVLYAPEADRYVGSAYDVSPTSMGIHIFVVWAHVWALICLYNPGCVSSQEHKISVSR
jgi:hypothetical protein